MGLGSVSNTGNISRTSTNTEVEQPKDQEVRRPPTESSGPMVRWLPGAGTMRSRLFGSRSTSATAASSAAGRYADQAGSIARNPAIAQAATTAATFGGSLLRNVMGALVGKRTIGFGGLQFTMEMKNFPGMQRPGHEMMPHESPAAATLAAVRQTLGLSPERLNGLVSTAMMWATSPLYKFGSALIQHGVLTGEEKVGKDSTIANEIEKFAKRNTTPMSM